MRLITGMVIAVMALLPAQALAQTITYPPPRQAVCAVMNGNQTLYEVFTGTDASTDAAQQLCQSVASENTAPWQIVDVMPDPRGSGWQRECLVQVWKQNGGPIGDPTAIQNAPGVSIFYLTGQAGDQSDDPTIQTIYNLGFANGVCTRWGGLGYGVGFDT